MLFDDVEKVGQEGGLKEYLGGVQKTMTWPTWKPFVEGAELTYILPAIGQELYDELTGSDELTETQLQLKNLLKRSLAWYAYLDAMPSLITVTGDGGMVMNSVPNTQAMPKWLFVATQKSHQDKADRYLESALGWLEHNADDFPTWKASPSFTIQNGRLIRSATEATRYFPAIQNSRRLYLSLRNWFNQAEEDFIIPILGTEFYQALMAGQLAGDFDGTAMQGTFDGQALILAKKAVVQYGFSRAIPYLNMNVDLRLVSETDGVVNENALTGERLNQIRNDALAIADRVAAQLKNYLNAHASEAIFPEYFTSPLYEAPVASGYVRRPTNDPSNPYFVL